MQFFLTLIGDSCFYKALKEHFDERTANVSMFFVLTTHKFNIMFMKTFANSTETILAMVGLYLFPSAGKKLDYSTAAFTAVLSTCVMIRCTSPIGWIPLLLIKVIYEKSFMPFLKSLFVVGIPVLSILVAMDSIFYNEFTLTPLNFVYVNVF
jgi:hypothetical protein